MAFAKWDNGGIGRVLAIAALHGIKTYTMLVFQNACRNVTERLSRFDEVEAACSARNLKPQQITVPQGQRNVALGTSARQNG